jgi:uncharacterized protein YecE (DUF72 family)
MIREPRHRVGCSGWQYKHWKGDFYPADVPLREWLEYYADRFDTVEVNNSFYRLPDEGVFSSWRERTPREFLFAVKASRFLTHMKKLKDPEEPVARLFSRARELRRKLGPVLYQLPKQMPKNLDRLTAFLDVLPLRTKHALEFRHPSWYEDDVLTLLRRRNVALCLHDMAGSASPRTITATFIYVRFHGATGRYDGAYPRETLQQWADWLGSTGRPAYVYFNNDMGGHAPRDAAALRSALAASVSPAVNAEGPVSNQDESTHSSDDPMRY